MTQAELRERLLAALAEALDMLMASETVDHGLLNLVANVSGALTALDRLDGRT